jgi:hypothetical protein
VTLLQVGFKSKSATFTIIITLAMPLFMDYHKHVVATFDEGVLAHLQDLEVQAKFSVRYLKWWLNEGEGIIYCLIEAPDAESCEAVHRHSHGMLACSIVEVDP